MANEQNGDLQMSDPQMNPKSKSGWKTTEFWLTLLAQIFPILESMAGNLKPEYAALISAAAQAFYSYQRYKIKTQ